MVPRITREFDGMRVETLDWPLILVEFPEGRVPDASVHALLDYLETLLRAALAEHDRVFFITDLTRMREITPASQRKYTAEWIARTATLQRAGSVGGAQITPSAILRGIITAVFWINPSPTKSILVATRNEAIFRGIGMLEAAGVELSARLEELRQQTRPDLSTERAGKAGARRAR